jgi:hypothetical protein
MIINPENPLHYQPEVIANHTLHVEEITFVDFPGFPEWLTFANVFICQCSKISQMLGYDFIFISHLIGVLMNIKYLLLLFTKKRAKHRKSR